MTKQNYKGAKPPYKPPKRQTAYGVKKRQEKKTEGEKAPRGKASLGIRGKELLPRKRNYELAMTT